MKQKWHRMEFRLAVYSFFFFLLFVSIFTVHIVAESNGATTSQSPYGVDYTGFYTTGQMSLDGRADELYDTPVHQAAMEQAIHRSLPYYLPWVYPPYYTLVLIPFSLLPFYPSLVLWLIVTLAFAVFAVSRLVPKHKELAILALGFPGVQMNLRWGQNGFFNAGLIGMGIYYLDTKPALAGLMFGMLAYKPQIAVFPLFILLICKKWRTLAWTAFFAGLLALVSGALFGFHLWIDYFQSFTSSATSLMDSAQSHLTAIQPTFFMVFQSLGMSSIVSYLLQGCVALLAAAAVWWVFRNTASVSLRGSALVLGLMLAMPYYLLYDLMILCIPLVLLCADFLENGARPVEAILLMLLWLIPLVNEPLFYLIQTHVFPFVITAVMVMAVLRVKKANAYEIRSGKEIPAL